MVLETQILLQTQTHTVMAACDQITAVEEQQSTAGICSTVV